jgi:hypothetical protein
MSFEENRPNAATRRSEKTFFANCNQLQRFAPRNEVVMSQPERVEIVSLLQHGADLFLFEVTCTFPTGQVLRWVERWRAESWAHAWNCTGVNIGRLIDTPAEVRIAASLRCLSKAVALAPDDPMIMANFLAVLRHIADDPMTTRQRMNHHHLGPDW